MGEGRRVDNPDYDADASENAPAGADDIVAAQIQYAAQSGRQRLTVERKEIASIRLAFDF